LGGGGETGRGEEEGVATALGGKIAGVEHLSVSGGTKKPKQKKNTTRNISRTEKDGGVKGVGKYCWAFDREMMAPGGTRTIGICSATGKKMRLRDREKRGAASC